MTQAKVLIVEDSRLAAEDIRSSLEGLMKRGQICS